MNRRMTWILIGISLQISAWAVPTPFKISGSISGAKPGDKVILSRIGPVELTATDTLLLPQDGEFAFSGQEDGSSIYYLTLNNTSSPGVPVIVEGGADVKVQVQMGPTPTYTVQGGLHNKDMKELYILFTSYESQLLALNARFDELSKVDGNADKSDSLRSVYTAKVQERRDAIAQFVESHAASPVSYFACRFLFARPDSRLVIRTAEKMGEEYPENEYSKALIAFRKQLGNTIEGAIAPDIRLPNKDGDTVSLHSLRGKVVLIDFWASWCGPCRRENPSVLQIYNKYKDQGFEIYGVSLDDTKGKWTTAILQDKIDWVHVSDLKGWGSSAGRLYGVHSIPQTFLLDQDGRIQRVGLRSHELEQAILELLSTP